MATIIEPAPGRVFRAFAWETEAGLLEAGTGCLAVLRGQGLLHRAPAPLARFLHHCERAQAMTVPLTAFTPVACWFLYQLGWMHGPLRLAGAGTYCALGWSFLVAGAADYWEEWDRENYDPTGASLDLLGAVALDIDPEATALARSNLDMVDVYHWFRSAVTAQQADAVEYLRQPRLDDPEWRCSLDLLFLDLDDPVQGKAGYRTAFEAAVPRLRRCACVVAHDGCCPRFANDIARLSDAIRNTPGWGEPMILPIDHAGLLLAFRNFSD